jgi:hypothetical protein
MCSYCVRYSCGRLLSHQSKYHQGSRSARKKHPAVDILLAEPLLALFSRDIALLDIADPGRRRAFVQVLHKLTQRVLVALCFAGDLKVLSVVVIRSTHLIALAKHTLPSLSFFT